MDILQNRTFTLLQTVQTVNNFKNRTWRLIFKKSQFPELKSKHFHSENCSTDSMLTKKKLQTWGSNWKEKKLPFSVSHFVLLTPWAATEKQVRRTNDHERDRRFHIAGDNYRRKFRRKCEIYLGSTEWWRKTKEVLAILKSCKVLRVYKRSYKSF